MADYETVDAEWWKEALSVIVERADRWLHPIGPAPEGWLTQEGCSRTIPHDENSEEWMNDEMNADHYRQVTPD